MQGFRSRRFDILVATDIAARGIDVQGISHVINFDVPNTPEAYTHRIGRTGRAELEGRALTFVTPDDAAWLRATERKLGSPIQRRIVKGFEADSIEASSERKPSRSGDRARPRRRKQGRPARRSARPRRRQG